MNQIQRDKELILALGGPTTVANMLGMKYKGAAQRIQNWMTRGIPPRVKVDHPEIFMGRDHWGTNPNQLAGKGI